MSVRVVWHWLWAQTLRGLLLLVPLIITVEFIVWLSRTIESQLKPLVSVFLPSSWYVPGIALLLFLTAALVLGLLTRNVLLRKMVDLTERAMTKMPVVGSIYPVVRQLTDLLSGKDKNQNGSVVLVSLPGAAAQVIGIVTRPADSPREPWLPPDSDLVYVPMSYQMGGFTLIVSRAHLQPLNLKPGEALQIVIMGGMAQPKAAR